jgi:hypothetical protein
MRTREIKSSKQENIFRASCRSFQQRDSMNRAKLVELAGVIRINDPPKKLLKIFANIIESYYYECVFC